MDYVVFNGRIFVGLQLVIEPIKTLLLYYNFILELHDNKSIKKYSLQADYLRKDSRQKIVLVLTRLFPVLVRAL